MDGDGEGLTDLAPGSMTFAFGKRAYYLYWVRPDGRIGWGANLPSPQYLSPAGGACRLRLSPGCPDTARDLRRRHPWGMSWPSGVPHQRNPAGGGRACTSCRRCRTGFAIAWCSLARLVHAPSNSTGQGASLAMESAIQLARCLRDLPELALGLRHIRTACAERAWRRSPPEGERISHAKAPGPVAQRMMRVMIPLMLKTTNNREDDGRGAALTPSTGTRLWRTKSRHSHDVHHATSMMPIMRNAATKRADSKRESLDRILDAAARRLREEGLERRGDRPRDARRRTDPRRVLLALRQQGRPRQRRFRACDHHRPAALDQTDAGRIMECPADRPRQAVSHPGASRRSLEQLRIRGPELGRRARVRSVPRQLRA